MVWGRNSTGKYLRFRAILTAAQETVSISYCRYNGTIVSSEYGTNIRAIIIVFCTIAHDLLHWDIRISVPYKYIISEWYKVNYFWICKQSWKCYSQWIELTGYKIYDVLTNYYRFRRPLLNCAKLKTRIQQNMNHREGYQNMSNLDDIWLPELLRDSDIWKKHRVRITCHKNASMYNYSRILRTRKCYDLNLRKIVAIFRI